MSHALSYTFGHTLFLKSNTCSSELLPLGRGCLPPNKTALFLSILVREKREQGGGLLPLKSAELQKPVYKPNGKTATILKYIVLILYYCQFNGLCLSQHLSKTSYSQTKGNHLTKIPTTCVLHISHVCIHTIYTTFFYVEEMAFISVP